MRELRWYFHDSAAALGLCACSLEFKPPGDAECTMGPSAPKLAAARTARTIGAALRALSPRHRGVLVCAFAPPCSLRLREDAARLSFRHGHVGPAIAACGCVGGPLDDGDVERVKALLAEALDAYLAARATGAAETQADLARTRREAAARRLELLDRLRAEREASSRRRFVRALVTLDGDPGPVRMSRAERKAEDQAAVDAWLAVYLDNAPPPAPPMRGARADDSLD